MVSVTEQQIPEGYKQAASGIIPNNWKVRQVQDICGFIVPGRNKPVKFDGVIPWITTPDLIDGRVVYKSRSGLKISKEEASAVGSKIVPAGSVIMSCVGELGVVAIAGCDIVLNQQLHAFLPSAVVNNFYLAYALKTQEAYFYSAATKTALPYLNKDNCNATPIHLPSLKEQITIANALSDVDALIISLEKLIAKKSALKTAAMQQLLTGKKRLPPFDQQHTGYQQTELGEIPEDWEVIMLADAVIFLDGQRRPVKSGDRERMRGDYRYYGASGIVDYVNDYLFDGEFILLGEDGENILSRSLPLAFKVVGKFWVNNHAHIMQPNDDFNIDYLTEFLESLDYSLLNSGTAQPKLNKQNCLNIKVVSPSKKEQTVIAKVLTEMDAELNALKRNLNKTQQIKQGMMQELLSGRTRLTVSKEE